MFVEVKPSNYIVMSVITMLFFCFIFGLIALFVGMQVGGWVGHCPLWACRWVGGWDIALEVAQCVLLVGLQVGGWGIALEVGQCVRLVGLQVGGWGIVPLRALTCFQARLRWFCLPSNHLLLSFLSG